MSGAFYKRTAVEIPDEGRLVEWVSEGGIRELGKRVGSVWFPKGSDMYVYYTPILWRYVDDASES